jgi:hypothetical protein
MVITAQQVREKLNIGDARLKTLVAEGKLRPKNRRKKGAKKFFMKFDSKAVSQAAKELGLNGHAPKRAARVRRPQGAIGGIITRLARIEDAVQAIAEALL